MTIFAHRVSINQKCLSILVFNNEKSPRKEPTAILLYLWIFLGFSLGTCVKPKRYQVF